MKKIRNIIGAVARKENFFPREKLVNKIYEKLLDGNHILLSAPRRVGKSSIMYHLKDAPREGFSFIYLLVESVNTAEDFCDELLKCIRESSSVGKWEKVKGGVSGFFEAINLEIQGIKLESNPNRKVQRYGEQLDKVFDEINNNDFITVIMIDEFPQVIENITKEDEQGKEMAILFLHLCRELRQRAGEKLRFIYTGSIGLPSVVKKITSQAVINDITPFEVPPLNRKDAKSLICALLDYQSVSYNSHVPEEALDIIEWLTPFNIQLIAQELIDIHETNETRLEEKDVQEALKRVIHTRNNQYFSSYHDRLNKAFADENQHQFVVDLLSTLSNTNVTFSKADLNTLTQNKNISDQERQNILESLEYDGYISQNEEGNIAFASGILKMWWKKNF